MTLQVSQTIIDSFVSNLTILSNKTVLLLDDTFNFNDVLGSAAKSFPENLSSVVNSKSVIGSFQMPPVSHTGASIESSGPVTFKNSRNGKIAGFIIFDGDVSNGLVSQDEHICDKIIICSDSISTVGSPASMCIQELNAIRGCENIFYTFNLTFMGL